MPFRTKRQKIAASTRHTYIFDGGKINITGASNREASGLSFPKNALSKFPKSTQLESRESDFNNKLLKREVLKIVSISFVIIGLQIGLRLTLF